MGLGIATGTAVAEKIGTRDQVKVTAFGPPVNLAARLEGMTRSIGIPILIDGATAAKLDDSLHSRRLGTFIPYGLQSTHKVFELITEDSSVSVAVRENYQQALEEFERGNWSEAFSVLQPNIESDPASRSLASFIERHEKIAPANWSGAIELLSK